LHSLATILTIVIFIAGLVIDTSKNTFDIISVAFDIFIIVVATIFLSVINRDYTIRDGMLVVRRFGKTKIILDIASINKIHVHSSGAAFLVFERQNTVLYLERSFAPEQYDHFIETLSGRVSTSNCSNKKYAVLCLRTLF